MKIKIPVLVKDPEVCRDLGVHPTEVLAVEDEAFLDGPVSPRVAVIDFNPEDGSLEEPIALQRPLRDFDFGTYAVGESLEVGEKDVDRVATAVSVFGAVYKTIRMFEEPDALGRTVPWAFGSPQLLVVPRAGLWANAYYERESRSLQFFFVAVPNRRRRVYTAHSQDIVAHETAHALLDGIAPDLYNAVSPQALAIHEATADIAALISSLRCRELAARVLEEHAGDISRSSVFSGVAEQFAGALGGSRAVLRDLKNDKKLSDVLRSEPHELSEVLSGAFYEVFLRIYETLRHDFAGHASGGLHSVAAREASYVEGDVGPLSVGTDVGRKRSAGAKALFVAAERLKRMLLRGLDYLPPGDVSFADLARSVLAADAAAHPESGEQRHWLSQAFVKRQIALDEEELRVRTNFPDAALEGLDFDELLTSDYCAYGFAERNRGLLRIPDATPFEVRPRVDVQKLYWHGEGQLLAREVLFKVSWSVTEPNHIGSGLPTMRRYRAGTTLAIGFTDGRPLVRALLTASRNESDQSATDDLLSALLNNDLLDLRGGQGWHGLPLRSKCAATIASDVLRVHGLGRTLHVTKGLQA